MRINEIFLSLQGEGRHVGTPSVFVRFSGCNLRCPFCDTRHEEGTSMTEEEIAERVAAYNAHHVVLTGGEPALQLTDTLIKRLHHSGKYVAVETNGTHPLPPCIDWVTLSPKFAFTSGNTDIGLANNHQGSTHIPPANIAANKGVVITHCNELKAIFTNTEAFTVAAPRYLSIPADHYLLQPCDTGDAARNRAITAQAIRYCLNHTEWSLSLQTHKLLGIP